MVVIHGSSALMDAAVAVTLASSALFAVDVQQARVTILLSLLGTLIPFILLAPSATLLVEKIKTPRIVLAIIINAMRCGGLVLMAIAASSSSTTRLAVFPLAFIMLTLSKCYMVTKTSSLPQITSVEKFPYFSSRLAMVTGVVSSSFGLVFLTLNSVFAESNTLFFAAFLSLIAISVSVISYVRLHRRFRLNVSDVGEDEEEVIDFIELSMAKRKRAIKSLFTFSCAMRFAVGLVTIGIGLNFRTDELMLALCFLSAAIASFATNAIAVHINRSRVGPVINYFNLAGLVGISIVLLLSSTQLSYLLLSGVLGAVSTYTRVFYESRAAHIIPEEFSTRLLARGEVWMQLSWVVGAACAVLSYASLTIATLCVLATFFCVWAYGSHSTLIKKN